jgi:protein ImuB
MRRFVSIWLPHWPTDCWRRRQIDGPSRSSNRPLALTVAGAGGVALHAVDALAATEGLQPGRPLADARALVPKLCTAPADPDGDRTTLGNLADWCLCYTPSVALDGSDGLLLDVTGCAHLFGGEAALLDDLNRRLARARIAAKTAVADTPAAAWAVARFGSDPVVPPESARAVLSPLPVAALKLPADLVQKLFDLGLRRIGDLLPLPTAPLSARFGESLPRRLDQLLGRAEEPMAPRRPPAPWRTRLAFAEPIGRREDIDAALRRLLDELEEMLTKGYRGARRIELVICRVDGTAQVLAVGTSRATRDAAHLFRLFSERLDAIDPGFGIETMVLEATGTDPLTPDQAAFDSQRGGGSLDALIDRLKNRLGNDHVFHVAPVDSHIPERAIALVASCEPCKGTWPRDRLRPVRLLPCPEPIEASGAVNEVPDRFRWRSILHRVVRSEGPERIAPEWWRAPRNARTRDYYWFEDENGRRFWVYRTLPKAKRETPRWYLHGLFA